MQKRRLRNIEVSPIGMGCMGFSHGYGQIPKRSYSIEAIQRAHDFGCTFFDTAEGYGNVLYYAGHNEEIVGEAVKDFRKDIVLATKVYGNGVPDTVKDIEADIRQRLEASMRRLQTDYVDLYYLHRMNDNVPVEEIATIMGRLIKEGKILGWGLSQVGIDTLRKAHEVTPVTAVQNLYNILERDCEQDIFPYCLEHNIGVVPFSPVASGFLSGKVTSTSQYEAKDDVRRFVPQLATEENIRGNQPILDIIKTLAEHKLATPAQVSMAWMLHKYPNVVPIPGSKNQERILENLGAWNVELTDEEFRAFEEALSRCTVYGHRGVVESQQNSFGNQWRDKINSKG